MQKVMCKMNGVEIELSGPDSPLEKLVYETLGMILYNIGRLTPPADSVRTTIYVSENNLIRVGEDYGGWSAVLDIDPTNKKIQRGSVPRGYRDNLTPFKAKETFEKAVAKVFPGYEISSFFE